MHGNIPNHTLCSEISIVGVGIALYGPYGLLKFGFHFWVLYSSVWWVKIVYRIFQGKNETIVVNLLSDGRGG